MSSPEEVVIELERDQYGNAFTPLYWKNFDTITREVYRIYDGVDKQHANLLPQGFAFAKHGLLFMEPPFRRPDLERFFESYDAVALNTVMAGIRLELENYLAQWGVGALGVKVQPIDNNGESVLPSSDVASPVMGVVLPSVRSRTQVLAGFPVCENPQLIEGLGICGTSYSQDRFALLGKQGGRLKEPDDIHVGTSIIVPRGDIFGLSVPVLDADQLERSGLPHKEVRPVAKYDKSSLYMQRFLTAEAAMNILQKPN